MRKNLEGSFFTLTVMRMYKILQLGKHYPPFIGGTERFIKELTDALNRKGVRCDVLCANDKAIYEELDLGSYRVIKVPNYFRMASTSMAPAMIAKLREIQRDYDIIHVHMPDPMANLALFLSGTRAKVIMQWHMDIYRYRKLMFIYSPLLKWIFSRADHVVVSSHALKEKSEFSRYMKGKVSVIPLGISLKDFWRTEEDPAFKNYLENLSMGRKIVLSVGRLVYYKGFDTLVNSMRHLPEGFVTFIVGDGPLKRDLYKLIEEQGLRTRVFLLGRLSYQQLVTMYKNCFVFCLPSKFKTEAFGLVQLEAMSFGKPIVSTRVEASGICEVNIHGETGLCVEPNNPHEIAKAILTLSDMDLYKTFSENAYKRALNFDIDNIVNRWLEVYERSLYS